MDSEKNENKQFNFLLPDVSSINRNKVAPIYGLPSPNARHNEPDYIPMGSKRGRDLYGNIAFHTGILWLGGYLFGGIKGTMEGLATAPNSNFRIKLNSVMNACSKHGSRIGNTAGIVGFMHTSVIGLSDMIDLDQKLGTEEVTHILAGAVPAFTLFFNRGRRGCALATVVGATISVAYHHLPNLIENVAGGKKKF